MRVRDNVATSFYEKRDLPVPSVEYWPENSGDLRQLVVEGREGSVPPRLIIGDGQHVRPSLIGERSFEAIRVEKCERILSVDRESKIVRVEAGIRWQTLQEEVADRGLSLQRFRLYPATATLGGLLSRHHATHREMFDGDVRTRCCALSAVSPASSDYRYIAAPRKASGPDLRHMYMGGEGLLGAILDVTLTVSAPTSGCLFTWNPDDIHEAVDIVRSAYDSGVRVTWSHYNRYKTSDNVLVMAVHGPEPILAAVERRLRDTNHGDFEVGNTEAAREKRQKLETGHPDRRTLATSRRTLAAWFSLRDLADAIDTLSEDEIESVEVWDWTRHRARAFIRFPRGEEKSELPAEAAARALEVRPVMDDEAVYWPHWSQTLKTILDPERELATGP